TVYLSRATEYVMDSTSPGGDPWPSFSEATIRQVPPNRASSFLVASSEASRPDPVTSTPNATTIRNVLRIIHLPNSGKKGTGRAPGTWSRCATDRLGSARGPVARRFPSMSGLEGAAFRRRGRRLVPDARPIPRQLPELVGDQSEVGVDLTQRRAAAGQD